jgi:hypothetical protein
LVFCCFFILCLVGFGVNLLGFVLGGWGIWFFLSRLFDYPPKSSKLTFSGGTPKSSTILRTAAFISGGPQK